MVTVTDEWASLRGKVAVVTGGAGGLGRPITEDLARAGAAVAVCDRDPEATEAVGRSLTELGAQWHSACFDVRDSERLAVFFHEVDERFDRGVDVLVNVPGGGFRKPAIDLTPNGVTAVIRQNFVHVLEASQLAARRMRDGGEGGSIVTVSTVEAHRAMPDMAVYGAMKAAAEHLTRTLAVEWGPYGIRVNSVAPDHFPTPASKGAGWSEDSVTAPGDGVVIPLGRKGTGRELSGCVLFLASAWSSYVTGTTLHVDGGTLAAAGWMRWPEGYENLIPPEVVASVPLPPAGHG